MTLDECTAWLTPLALAMRADFDAPTFRGYAAMLADVPLGLAEEGFRQLANTGITFFPTAPEIQAAAEKVRRQQLALHPWTPCCDCEDQPGWMTVNVAGVCRLAPCPCKSRHRELLASRGLLEPIAVLPTEGGAGDERVYPTIDQLPAKIQKQLGKVANQKVLR